MTNKIKIATNAAPPSTGTHSQAIRIGDLVFVTAQSGRDPRTGKLVEGGVEEQTRQMLTNIEAILNAAGCTQEDIVKSMLLMSDIKDFKAIDALYAAWLPGLGVTPLPARTAFGGLALPAGALVMLDVVAAYPRV
ncbi:MAG TPA: Rid family hydrolase [Thermoanaerobaculia bacterium]|jgi:2-iminobutanoate/2-iminopropanoate deaminase|nr:Rid family hydrolase [Thermoanaerobaculia bacterium]